MDPGNNPLGEPTSFVIGVGVNPGATDLEYELQRFYWKVEAGAEYAITQPVFDPGAAAAIHRRDQEAQHLDSRSLPVSGRSFQCATQSSWRTRCLESWCQNEIVTRMRVASEKGKEFALQEGIAIAREMFERVATVRPGPAGECALREGRVRAAGVRRHRRRHARGRFGITSIRRMGQPVSPNLQLIPEGAAAEAGEAPA